jgi:hypothetical protein
MARDNQNECTSVAGTRVLRKGVLLRRRERSGLAPERRPDASSAPFADGIANSASRGRNLSHFCGYRFTVMNAVLAPDSRSRQPSFMSRQRSRRLTIRNIEDKALRQRSTTGDNIIEILETAGASACVVTCNVLN